MSLNQISLRKRLRVFFAAERISLFFDKLGQTARP